MKNLLLLLLFFTLSSPVMLTAQDDVNFLAGERALTSSNYIMARDYYTSYIRTFEGKLPAYLSKIYSYDTSNSYEKLTLFPGYSINHDWAVGFYKRGLTELNTNDNEQAVKDFSTAIQIDPKYAEPYVQKGLLLKGKGRNEVCKYISEARYLNDTLKSAKNAYRDNFCFMCGLEYFTKGKTEVDLKQYAEGLQNLNMAIAYCHDSASYFAYRGIAFEGVGKIDSAILDYSYAIKNDSGSYVAYYNRALLYEQEKRYRESFMDLAKVLVLYPKFADAYMHQAMDCEEDLNLPADAIYDYQQVIHLKPTEGLAWYKIGLHIKKEGQDACNYFQKAADLGCDDAQSYVDDCQKEAEKKAMR